MSTYTKGPDMANIGVTMSDALALTARQQQYLGTFWNDYLPNGRAFSDQACMLSTGSWTGAVNRLHGTEPLLHKAMMALSASVLGAQNHDMSLKLKGLQTYCSATADMLNAVQHRKRARSDGVLAAIRLLEFYEACTVPCTVPYQTPLHSILDKLTGILCRYCLALAPSWTPPTPIWRVGGGTTTGSSP
jgi:hypothetical protein